MSVTKTMNEEAIGCITEQDPNKEFWAPRTELVDLDNRQRSLLGDRTILAKTGLNIDVNSPSFDEAAIAEILSAELDKMSLAEQERILFDIHGLPQGHNDDPPNIDDYLQEMEMEIRKVRNKSAYLHAKYVNEDYVNDRAFRLMFLRGDLLDVKVAAQRMVFHFETKKRLFGDGDVLGRDIRLSDLSNDDMAVLESGFLQVLPTRDAAGRTIFVAAPLFRPSRTTVVNMHRAIWYFCTVTLKDEDAQRKGIVAVVFNTGKDAYVESLPVIEGLGYVQSAIPKKVVGMHYCFNNAALKAHVTATQLCLDKEVRSRFRMHLGNHDHISFVLQTYGIPVRDNPVQPDGSVSLDWHKEWMQAHKLREESEKTLEKGDIVPRRFDVLFGRGRTTREHTGNLRAAHLVEMFQNEYEAAGKFEKTKIAERIVDIVHESYGRFLKWEPQGWVEVSRDSARDKVSHFFRHLRSRTGGVTNHQVDSESGNSVVKRVSPSPCVSTDVEGGQPHTKLAKEETQAS